MPKSAKTQIWQMGVTEMARAIRHKEFSCVEAVSAHLARIAKVNDTINAVTVVLEASALDAARAADQRLAHDEAVPPLLGIPMTIKENIDCAGSATTFGVQVLKDARPEVDAPFIQHLRAAGAIPIGRTNMPDLGLRIHTDNDLNGPTLNPWDRSLTPGGSSGGDAAAVATGMTPLGLGNDYGGSLRYPANFCGIATLRPSLGRVPDHMSLLPAEPAITLQLFMVQGPMARTVADLRAALEIMCQPDPRDPWWNPAPLFGPPLPAPIRVAMVTQPGDGQMDSGVVAGVEKAGQALSAAGYEVEAVEPPMLTDLWRLWIDLTGAELRSLTLPNVKQIISAGALKFLTYWIESFPDRGLAGYMTGLAQRNRISRKWCRFQEKYPLIIGPVTAGPPFKRGGDIASREDFNTILKGCPLTMSANVLGLPAVALPVDLQDGLPLGVQIIAPRLHDDLCLNAAQALEEQAGVITPTTP